MKTTMRIRFVRRLTAIWLLGAVALPAGPMEDAAAHLKAGRAQEAETAYSQVLAAKADDVAALLGRGRARQALRDRAGAAADFDQAVKLAPKNAEVWQRRGQFRETLGGDVKGALDDYNDLVVLAPKSPLALVLRGIVLIKLRAPKAALVDANNAIRYQPEFAPAHSLRGYALEMLELETGAVESYQAALKLDPKNSLARTRLEALAPTLKAKAEASPLVSDLGSQVAAAAKAYDTEKLKAAGDPEAGGLLTSVPKEAALSNEEYAKLQQQKAARATPPEPAAPPAPAASGRPRSTAAAATERPAVASAKPAAAAVAEKRPAPPAAEKPPVPAVAKPPPAEPSATAASLEYLHRSNFLQLMINGSHVLATDAGERPFVTKGGGYALLGIPLCWSGDEFYFSGARPEIVRPDRKGMYWNKSDATYLVWGKIAADGAGVEFLRVVFYRSDGSRLDLELRDLGLRNRNASPDDPTVVAPNFYSQHAANADSAEMFHSLARIRDADRPFSATRMVDGKQESDPATRATLAEFRPFAHNVAIYRDRDLAASPGPAESLPAVRAKVAAIMAQPKSWAAIRPITDERLAELFPQWVGQRAAADLLEVRTVPAGRTELRADGRDGIRLQARVKPQGGAPTAEQQAATKTITFLGEGDSAKWLDFSPAAAALTDGWKETQVQASNPDSVRGGANQPPEKFVIRITAQNRGRQMVKQFELGLGLDPAIDAKPDWVEFVAQSGKSTQVRVAIDHAGPDPWKIRTEYEKKSRPLATVEVQRIDGKSATLTLKEAGLVPVPDGSSDERATLRVIAEQSGRDPLERDLKILVAQEGLFVASTNRDPLENLFRLSGDGSGKAAEIDFRVFAQDPATSKMVNLVRRPEALQSVMVECLELPGTAVANLLEVGQFKAEIADQVRPLNEPAGILRMTLAKEVPWDGRIVPCDFRLTYPERGEAAFSAIVTVGVVTTANGPGSADWHLELDRCQEVINRFVPATYYSKMQALLDRRKTTLGAEGLRALRSRIWGAAVEFTLGEGGQGYASEAAWAGAITEVLEWSQWAGDMAFGAVIGTWTGPYGALGASSLKSAVISALTAYQEGRGADEWLWENLATIPGILEGKIIDVDTFEKLGVESKAQAWAIFIGYHFIKNIYNGATVVDALTNTAKTVGGDVLSSWLGAEVRKSGSMTVSSWASAKGQELGAAVTSTVTRTPDAAAPKQVAAEPFPAPTAKMPVKTAVATPAAKAPVKAAGQPDTKGPRAPDAAKQPAIAETPVAKSDSQAAAKSPETQGPTKPAASEPDAKAPRKSGEPEQVPPTKTGTENETKVAGTDENAPAKAKPVDGAAAKTTPEPSTAQVAEAVDLVSRRTSRSPDGKAFAHRDDVLTIMKDPSMVRALKNAPAEVQEAFSNTREAIYKAHDAAVVDHVKKLPGMENRLVRVMEFRTPGATGPSLNTDRDYRVCYFSAGGQWIEVPRAKWEVKSYETFAKLTGGPAGTPAEAKHWAEQHQQLGTDKYHPEASPDFSDQKTVWNPQTKQMEKIQVEPNILAVKEGQPDAKLQDPQALGHMYEMKVGDAKFPHEKFVQAQKAVKELDAVREGYAKQKRNIGQLPPKMRAAMDAVIAVNKKLADDPNRRDPQAIADAEKTLQENGFRDMGDFMNKLSSQFESLKMVPGS